MISILPKQDGTRACVLKLLQRSGLTKIVAFSWCGAEHDAGAPGIMQVPAGILVRCCEQCQAELAKVKQ